MTVKVRYPNNRYVKKSIFHYRKHNQHFAFCLSRDKDEPNGISYRILMLTATLTINTSTSLERVFIEAIIERLKQSCTLHRGLYIFCSYQVRQVHSIM